MKNINIILISVILAGVTFATRNIMNSRNTNDKIPNLVITETGKYTSLDPLDADSTQNLPVSRMLYLTPLEIKSDNTLGSYILEKFEYKAESNQIIWQVKKGVSFSNGEEISPEDVAFAIERMAYARPDFPVLKLIKGLKEWRNSSDPLKTHPEGIKISGNFITIELTESHPHPLFRFCLEIFSIIPKNCVDLKTNKIKCEEIPTSGYYVKIKEDESHIQFLRKAQITKIHDEFAPEEIRFTYLTSSEAFSQINDDFSVIHSNEAKFSSSELKRLEDSFSIGYSPSAWFTILQLNDKYEPFKDAKCRFLFADKFRSNYQKISGIKQVESSVFTKLVAGYIPQSDFDDKFFLSEAEYEACLEQYSKYEFQLGYDLNSDPQSYIQALELTLKDLKISSSKIKQIKSRKEGVDLYLSGQINSLYSRTGFWALDPAGDIQMLFTPGLHKALVDFWNDSILQNQLSKVIQNGKISEMAFIAINEHLYSDAKFNVFSHIRKFYASKNKKLVSNLPIGITSPSPWHIFRNLE